MTDKQLMDNPQAMPEEMKPETATDYVQRGWLFYSQKKYEQAIKDYNEALSREPDTLDTHYALALALKYSGQTKLAAEEFTRVIDLAYSLDDRIQAIMITRLAKGHINEMQSGDWGLEEELWQKKP